MGPSRACRPCYAPPPREEFPKENPTEHDRCGSQVVRQRIANPLHVGSNPIRTSPTNSSPPHASRALVEPGEGAAVCTSVCTHLDEATLEGAIASVTRALAATDDPQVAGELVTERRALREELRELGEAGAGVVRLDDARARGGR
jgi:hypothetical protein